MSLSDAIERGAYFMLGAVLAVLMMIAALR
jgi:hypothetical protein